ncbi:MAG: hypothetical protein BGN86_17060 [Caulobacterales bacterium 68-7]|nr:hypothetical protein [Caulobacterales bacterium]OJU10902.1 MAG: hypothetical protein BGN86_17060 [Caulobacterales bacterium 68-7]
MDTNTLIVVAVVVLIVVAIVAFALNKARRTAHLKSNFGPEYDRAVEESDNARHARAELREREKRVRSFDIHPLDAGDRSRFIAAWTQVQSEFVDDPRAAVSHADDLLADVMAARGYPVSDFDQRSADLSVDHPVVVQNYRSGHDIFLKHKRGDAGTEDLRQAMIHYRALFEDLTKTDLDPPPVRERIRA